MRERGPAAASSRCPAHYSASHTLWRGAPARLSSIPVECDSCASGKRGRSPISSPPRASPPHTKCLCDLPPAGRGAWQSDLGTRNQGLRRLAVPLRAKRRDPIQCGPNGGPVGVLRTTSRTLLGKQDGQLQRLKTSGCCLRTTWIFVIFDEVPHFRRLRKPRPKALFEGEGGHSNVYRRALGGGGVGGPCLDEFDEALDEPPKRATRLDFCQSQPGLPLPVGHPLQALAGLGGVHRRPDL